MPATQTVSKKSDLNLDLSAMIEKHFLTGSLFLDSESADVILESALKATLMSADLCMLDGSKDWPCNFAFALFIMYSLVSPVLNLPIGSRRPRHGFSKPWAVL